jgi:hypothetical protein
MKYAGMVACQPAGKTIFAFEAGDVKYLADVEAVTVGGCLEMKRNRHSS